MSQQDPALRVGIFAILQRGMLGPYTLVRWATYVDLVPFTPRTKDAGRGTQRHPPQASAFRPSNGGVPMIAQDLEPWRRHGARRDLRLGKIPLWLPSGGPFPKRPALALRALLAVAVSMS